MVMEEFADFESFAQRLFSQDPQPPKTICLDVEFGGDDNGSRSLMADLLSDIFAYGLRHKFAHVPHGELTEQHFNVLRDYIRSLGYDAELINADVDDMGYVSKIDVGFKVFDT